MAYTVASLNESMPPIIEAWLVRKRTASVCDGWERPTLFVVGRGREFEWRGGSAAQILGALLSMINGVRTKHTQQSTTMAPAPHNSEGSIVRNEIGGTGASIPAAASSTTINNK